MSSTSPAHGPVDHDDTINKSISDVYSVDNVYNSDNSNSKQLIVNNDSSSKFNKHAQKRKYNEMMNDQSIYYDDYNNGNKLVKYVDSNIVSNMDEQTVYNNLIKDSLSSNNSRSSNIGNSSGSSEFNKHVHKRKYDRITNNDSNNNDNSNSNNNKTSNNKILNCNDVSSSSSSSSRGGNNSSSSSKGKSVSECENIDCVDDKFVINQSILQIHDFKQTKTPHSNIQSSHTAHKQTKTRLLKQRNKLNNRIDNYFTPTSNNTPSITPSNDFLRPPLSSVFLELESSTGSESPMAVDNFMEASAWGTSGNVSLMSESLMGEVVSVEMSHLQCLSANLPSNKKAIIHPSGSPDGVCGIDIQIETQKKSAYRQSLLCGSSSNRPPLGANVSEVCKSLNVCACNLSRLDDSGSVSNKAMSTIASTMVDIEFDPLKGKWDTMGSPSSTQRMGRDLLRKSLLASNGTTQQPDYQNNTRAHGESVNGQLASNQVCTGNINNNNINSNTSKILKHLSSRHRADVDLLQTHHSSEFHNIIHNNAHRTRDHTGHLLPATHVRALSNNGNMMLSIPIYDLLSDPELADAHYDTDAYLQNINRSFIELRRKIDRKHYNDTEPNGYCFYLAQRQLSQRHNQVYSTTIPTCLDIAHHNERQLLSGWLNMLSSLTTHGTTAYDKLLKVKNYLQIHESRNLSPTDRYTDSKGIEHGLWFSNQDISDIAYHWPQTFWAQCKLFTSYSTIQWTNNLRIQREFSTSNQFSYNEAHQILSLPNDYELSGGHYYLRDDDVNTSIQQLDQAMIDMKRQVNELSTLCRNQVGRQQLFQQFNQAIEWNSVRIRHRDGVTDLTNSPSTLIAPMQITMRKSNIELNATSFSGTMVDLTNEVVTSSNTSVKPVLIKTSCQNELKETEVPHSITIPKKKLAVNSTQDTNSVPNKDDNFLDSLNGSTPNFNFGDLYPLESIRKQFSHLHKLTKKGTSTIGAGNSLFANTTLKKKQLIGIYGGVYRNNNYHSAYWMQLTVEGKSYSIDGHPNNINEYSRYGLINEFIWDSSMNNVVVDKVGKLTMTKDIKKDSELFLHYGDDYDWSDYIITTLIPNLIDSLHKATDILHAHQHLPTVENICNTLNSWTSAAHLIQATQSTDALHKLLVNVLKGNLSINTRHMIQPHANADSSMIWIEQLLTCEIFYLTVAFRHALHPHEKADLNKLNTSIADTSKYGRERISKFIDTLVNDSRKLRWKSSLLLSSKSTEDTSIKTQHHTTVTAESLEAPLILNINHEHVNKHFNQIMNIDDTQLGETFEHIVSKNITSHSQQEYTQLCQELKVEVNTPLGAPLHTHALSELANILSPPVAKPNQKLDNQLKTMFYNAGSFSEYKQITICNSIISLCLDVIFIFDTRIDEQNSYQCKKTFKLKLGSKYRTHIVPSVKIGITRAIGGMIIITSNRLSYIKLTQLVCKGALVQLDCRFDKQVLVLLGLYMPNMNDAEGSFQQQLKHETKTEDIQQHIRDTLTKSILTHQAAGTNIIVGGDFNSDIGKDDNMKMLFLLSELELEHSATRQQRMQATYVRGLPGEAAYIATRPDHVLHYGQSIIPRACHTYDHTAYTNDHRPLVAAYEVKNCAKYHHTTLQHQKRIQYNPNDERQSNMLDEKLLSIDLSTDMSPADRLEHVTTFTVQAVSLINKSKRSKRGTTKTNWSPINQALAYQLEAISEMRRRVFGFRCTIKLTDRTYVKVLATIRKKWRHKLRQLAKSDEQFISFLQLSIYNPLYWTDISFYDLSTSIGVAFQETKKLLSNKLRKQRFTEFTQAIENREFNFQINKLGSVIKSVMGSKRHYYSMEELKIEGERLIEPGQIHEILTNNFDKWFETPIAEQKEDWPNALHNYEPFKLMCDKQLLPNSVSQALWTAINKKVSDTPAVLSFKSEVMDTPSFDEYMKQVNASKSGSAAGMSDLSYDMMKAWTSEIHEAVYVALATLWNDKTIIDSWKWKWLNPIPKNPDPSISELRPLCLIEVIRKVWSVIFVRRITSFLHKSDITHKGQHCGVGKGTETGVIEFAATLETAKELKTEVFISSWDLKRAFDSVDRRLLVFSWTRLGVPLELAQYLVDMDADSSIVVRSPLAALIYEKLGKEGLKKHNADFTPGRGTAQGGVDSTAVYSAFTDILLCALSAVTGGEFYISDVDGNLRGAIPVSYVDDLITAQSKSHKLQEMADIVSGFCIIFHLELNTKKFRAYSINWGNHHRPPMTELIIHIAGWKRVIVSMQMDGSFTHLGVVWDMDVTNSTQFNNALHKLKHSLAVLLQSKASASIKIKVMELVLYSQIIYDTKFASWPLHQYQQLDSIVTTAVKQITNNMVSYPTDLIYMKKDQMGLGIKQLSVCIQEAKYAIYQRAIHSMDDRRRFVMSTMLARGLRDSDSQPVQGGAYSTNNPLQLRNTWWCTSLIQHLQTINMSISRTAIAHNSANQHIAIAHLENNRPRRDNLHSLGILTQGELAMDCDEDEANEVKAGVHWASKLATLNTPLLLRVGQVWATCKRNGIEVFEIAGFHDTLIHYYPWVIKSKNKYDLKVTDTLYIEKGTSVMKGAGSDSISTFQDLFNLQEATRLIHLTKETYNKDGTNEASITLIRDRTALNNTTPQYVKANVSDKWNYREWGKQSIQAFYTATNKKSEGLVIDHLLDTCQHINNSTVVAQCKDEYHALVIQTNDNLSNVKLHLMAQQAAASLQASRRQPIITNSVSSIKLQHNRLVRTSALDTNPICRLKSVNRLLLHVPSIRLKAAISTNNKNEATGMLKATQASNNSKQFTINNPHGTIRYISQEEVLRQLTNQQHGSVINSNGNIFIGNIADEYTKLKTKNYLHKRNDYRNSRLISNNSQEQQNYWVGATTVMAAKIFKNISNISTKSMINRIVWDKTWHGRNSVKSSGIEEDAICKLCGQGIEDQEHIIWHCRHPRMCAVREAALQLITKRVEDISSSRSEFAATIRAYNNIVMKKNNYSLLFGRVHDNQREAFKQLPQTERMSSAKQQAHSNAIIKHHRTSYAPFVIAMYSERNNITTDALQLEQLKLKHKSTWWYEQCKQKQQQKCPHRMVIESREMLLGIEQTHTLYTNGIPVTSDRSIEVIKGYKRTDINYSNSVVLRNDLKEAAARTTRTKQTTIPDFLLSPPPQRYDTVVLSDHQCVLIPGINTDIIPPGALPSIVTQGHKKYTGTKRKGIKGVGTSIASKGLSSIKTYIRTDNIVSSDDMENNNSSSSSSSRCKRKLPNIASVWNLESTLPLTPALINDWYLSLPQKQARVSLETKLARTGQG